MLPSTSLIGKERAETRVLEFHHGEQEFDVPDLAFGGYTSQVPNGAAADPSQIRTVDPLFTSPPRIDPTPV